MWLFERTRNILKSVNCSILFCSWATPEVLRAYSIPGSAQGSFLVEFRRPYGVLEIVLCMAGTLFAVLSLQSLLKL